MSNFLEFPVEENKEEHKIREYLREKCGLSGRFIKSASKELRIYVNGKKIKSSYVLKSGDIIKINIDKDESQNINPEKMDLHIVYEDEYLLIVNKPPFMVVHPTKSHSNGTLSNGIMYHFKETNQDCIVRLANRLDMNTSGLVMIVKNQYAHMKISEFMNSNLIEKEYRAIVHGKFKESVDTINEPIGRPTMDSIERVVMEGGLESITHYEVEEQFEQGALLKVNLETGRTHQIRVHLSHIGHPIFGDILYGNEDKGFINRQALHAYRLSFPHPVSGEKIDVKCQIPEDMKNLCDRLNVNI